MPTKHHTDDAESSAEIHGRVAAQFGAAASAYTVSLTHSDPAALARVVSLARPKPTDVALDVATGAGHTALALAPHVAQVVAYDLTEPMLAETARNAASRGLNNVTTRQGPAESLPFKDASFDIITVRQAPHHFADVRAAVREMARVARSGARVIIIDSTAPEDESLAREWNHIEKLRDPSHVQNYRPSEWREFVASVGLKIVAEEVGAASEKGGPMDFSAWIRRINTPPDAAAEVDRLFRTASPALAQALRIEIVDGKLYFRVPQFTIVCLKP
ncbi:MAG TPA: methyltransferase domain-containing protein [Candidatus Dormibacteraeota bacterium]|nr:methyltransferase domain-containing protein [Candidatus Dormibacteraeota bacterium]